MPDLVFVIQEADRPARRVPVVVGMVLGRSDGCDCVLGKDGWTSKRHAQVVLDGDRIMLEDLGSANKTRVINGPTLSAGQRHEIAAGVQFGLGKAILTVEFESANGDLSSSPAFEKETERGTDFIKIDSGEFREGEDPAGVATSAEEFDLSVRTDAAPSFPSMDAYSRPPVEEPAPPKPSPDDVSTAPVPKPSHDESFGARTQIDEYDDPMVVKRRPAPPGGTHAAPRTAPPSPEPARPVYDEPSPIEPYETGPTDHSPGPIYPQTMVVSTGSDQRAAEERRGRARPRLVFTDEAIRRAVFIHASEFIVGRRKSDEREIHCVLPHDAVSSLHAKLTFDGHHFFIEDLGSANGTYVEGERLQPMQKRVLAPETAVRFGVIEAVFVIECDPSGEPVPDNLYETAVGLLLRRNLVTKSQVERSRQKAGEPRRLGETLLLDGIVSAEQWSKAFRHAEKIGALREVTHEGSSKMLIVGLSVMIGVAAITILALLLLLLLR